MRGNMTQWRMKTMQWDGWLVWMRFGAFVVDSFISFFILLMTFIPVAVIGLLFPKVADLLPNMIWIGVVALSPATFHGLLTWKFGRTIGKGMFRLLVKADPGAKLTLVSAIGREVMKVAVYCCLFPFAHIAQAILGCDFFHDIAFQTEVVRETRMRPSQQNALYYYQRR